MAGPTAVPASHQPRPSGAVTAVSASAPSKKTPKHLAHTSAKSLPTDTALNREVSCLHPSPSPHSRCFRC
ncbi:hypothetical protein HBH70_165430 [Parastagonospora nodorum]|nr:hypothetical protein HBH51_167300 [Parastagonospora nodorum]KAH3964737.1 hypothetical protein HBH52_208330 [Parastagonospora nodorum]KAH3995106.1 hypothetical protein HBI10_175830 [Parastagonospora nodorum]KAH4015508.1 hypothetical protein HBI09_205040 [Parastagonospora nodorum]KAH4017539.1 hypothetical protein HBI13_141360 [Parastagonospora nodorum]